MNLLKKIAYATPVLGMLAFSAPSHAVGTIWVLDPSIHGTTWQLVATDQGAGDERPGIPGIVRGSASFGNWTLVEGTGTTYPALGSATSPNIDLQSYTLSSSNGGGTIYVLFISTDFSLSSATAMSLRIGGTTDGTVQWAAFYSSANSGDANAFPGLGTCMNYNVAGTVGAFADTDSCLLPADSLFSLAQVVQVVHTGGGQLTTLDFSMKVPEPGSLALLGLGLIGFGLARSRKSN